MISFPNTFSKNNLSGGPGGSIASWLGTDLKSTMKNAFKSGLSAISNKVNKSGKNTITPDTIEKGFDFDTNLDRVKSLKSLNTSNDFILKEQSFSVTNAAGKKLHESIFENVFNIPAEVLSGMNKYNYIYTQYGVVNYTKMSNGYIEKTNGKDKEKVPKWQVIHGVRTIRPSLFNPWYGVPSSGFHGNLNTPVPLNVPIIIDGVLVNATLNSLTSENTKNIKNEEGIEKIKKHIDDTSSYSTLAVADMLSANSLGRTESLNEAKKETDKEKRDKKENKVNSTHDQSDKELNSLQENISNQIYDEKTINDTILPDFYDTEDDINDCTIKKLVDLSSAKVNKGAKSLGRSLYKYADFMYCKDLGKVANNHLITLRKFSAPIEDNILFSGLNGANIDQMLPDVGRLISWFGTDDNKLEDICKYDYSASWKLLESNIQDVPSKEDSNEKLLPSIANLTNPNYLKMVNAGISSNNRILRYLLPKGEHINDGNDRADYYYRDQNKVWEPASTVRDTHIYDGKLMFNQEITLNFSYKMRYYNGINGKAAFLDLLGNILAVTYKEGTFWGGEVRFIGPTPAKRGWKKINSLISDFEKASDDTIADLFGCSSAEDFLGVFGNAINNIGEFFGNTFENVKNYMQNMAQNMAGGKTEGLTGFLTTGIKNKLGRPALYSINSLLSNEPVGLWHLTVGNPRNPILSIGNLILTGSSIQHSGPLGIDDFPTDIKVTVNLKHAKSRDIIDIYKMYTNGISSIYTRLGADDMDKYYGSNWQTYPNADKYNYNNIYKDEQLNEKDIKAFMKNNN